VVRETGAVEPASDPAPACAGSIWLALSTFGIALVACLAALTLASANQRWRDAAKIADVAYVALGVISAGFAAVLATRRDTWRLLEVTKAVVTALVLPGIGMLPLLKDEQPTR
jgi:hypothetical protein